MKLLLHTCCGPCSIHPVRVLREARCEVMGFFYRSNIHPYTECMRREEALTRYAESIDLKLIVQPGYAMERFLRGVAFREADRCAYCYHDRLTTTAKFAKKGKFEGFSSTLLYSRFQQHDLIRTIGEAVGRAEKIPFVYRDFRDGWKEGVDASRRLGMYRQPYCGCIYSEKARFYRAATPTPFPAAGQAPATRS